MGLEQAIEFINDDELVEVTPRNIRLRKKILEGLGAPRRWLESAKFSKPAATRHPLHCFQHELRRERQRRGEQPIRGAKLNVPNGC